MFIQSRFIFSDSSMCEINDPNSRPKRNERKCLCKICGGGSGKQGVLLEMWQWRLMTRWILLECTTFSFGNIYSPWLYIWSCKIFCFLTWRQPGQGPFLQSPDNFSGPKSYIQIEVKRIRARVLANKILHFVSLADNCIMLDAKLLKLLSCM